MEADEALQLAPSTTKAEATSEIYTGTLTDFLLQAAPNKELNLLSTIFLLDARDPFSWRVPALEKELKAKKCDIVYGLSRADLVPKEQLCSYVANLSEESATFPICTPAPAKHLQKAREAGGIATLVEYLEKLDATRKKKKNQKEKAGVAVVGMENSGRTSLASILAATLPELVIYDTPAIVPARSSFANVSDQDEEDEPEVSDEDMEQKDREAAHRILIRNAGGIFKVREPVPLIDALLRRVAHEEDLMMSMNTPAFTDTNDFLIGVARASGRLKKGAIPDTIAAARTILREWSAGEIGYYAKPLPYERKDVKANASLNAARSGLDNDKSLANVVLPRKEWRGLWNGKEVRLTPGQNGMLGSAKVAFAKIAVDESEDDEDEELEDGDDDEAEDDEDEDDDVDFEEEDD